MNTFYILEKLFRSAMKNSYEFDGQQRLANWERFLNLCKKLTVSSLTDLVHIIFFILDNQVEDGSFSKVFL